jgi:hypothetical protein
MNLIAFSMFVSLIFILVNNLDPRTNDVGERASGLIKLLCGAILGFVIILLYGIGMPGLRYIFLIIGFGGILHLCVSHTLLRTYKIP